MPESDPSSHLGIEQQVVHWRQRALDSSREAALATGLLGEFLSSTKEGASWVLPIPIPPAAPILSASVLFHLDSLHRNAERINLRGWAFLPASTDCRHTRISCVLEVDRSWFAVPVVRVQRPDVAAAHPHDPGTEPHREHSGVLCHFESRSFPNLPMHAYFILQEGYGPALCGARIALPPYL